MEQGINQRKTNIEIISLIHDIHKILYRIQVKDTLKEKIKSEVKWINAPKCPGDSMASAIEFVLS